MPSSFLYCGEHLSWFCVDYWLEVKFIGLTQTTFGMPQAAVLQQRNEVLLIRAKEPPVKPGVSQEATGQLKGTFNSNKGSSKIVGYLPVDVTMQNSPLKLKLEID